MNSTNQDIKEAMQKARVFYWEVAKEQKLRFNKNKILTPEALGYLAYIAVKEYEKVYYLQPFENVEECTTILEKYKIENNSVLAFMNDANNMNAIRKAYPKYMPKSWLYEDYKCWCKNCGYEPKGRNNFYKDVEKTGKVRAVTIHGNDRYDFI